MHLLCKDLHDIVHQRPATLDSAWTLFYSSQALLIDTAYRAVLPALALMQDAANFPDSLNATALASTYADILAKLSLTKTLWVRLVDSDPYCSPSLPAAPDATDTEVAADATDTEDAADATEAESDMEVAADATKTEDKLHMEDAPDEEDTEDVLDVPEGKPDLADLQTVVGDEPGVTTVQVVVRACSANYLLNKPAIKHEQHEYSIPELHDSSSHSPASTHKRGPYKSSILATRTHSAAPTHKREPDQFSIPATYGASSHFLEPCQSSIPATDGSSSHFPEPRAYSFPVPFGSGSRFLDLHRYSIPVLPR
ncbi:hypothetical protein B0H21DRAFT_708874 [Amylocystis lapponica]|nr:hypothetical protein B0H21DRAFT_708874 [Amylocystis lapponica]